MTRRTSDSRSRHKTAKEPSLGKRGTRTRHLQHHEQQEQADQQRPLNATNANAHHDPTSSSLQQHPANCECWKLHPGLFLPESLLQPTKNPSHGNINKIDNDDDNSFFQHYPNRWNEDDYCNEKA